MFGCYRRGDANDPDTYVTAIAFILSKYSRQIIEAVTDPFSGLPSRSKANGYGGMPDVADVKAACEAEAIRIERMAAYAALPRFSPRALPGPPKGPGAFANVFVPPFAPQYAGFVERAKTADPREWRLDDNRPGIWVAYGWMFSASEGRKSFSQFTEAQLKALYPKRDAAVPAVDEVVPF